MAPKYILEQFIESELFINITEHMVGHKFNFWGLNVYICLSFFSGEIKKKKKEEISLNLMIMSEVTLCSYLEQGHCITYE